jgi:hypothetical protein
MNDFKHLDDDLRDVQYTEDLATATLRKEIRMKLEAPKQTATRRKQTRAWTESARPMTTTAGRRAARCASVIGDIDAGSAAHVISDGEWSLHDAIHHLARLAGPSEVLVATWSVSEAAVRLLCSMLDRGDVTRLTCLCDWRVKQRRPEAAAFLERQADSLRVTNCHAKAAVIIGGELAFSVVTSANLTNNPRLDVYVITEGRAVADFHATWIRDSFDTADPFSDPQTRLV